MDGRRFSTRRATVLILSGLVGLALTSPARAAPLRGYALGALRGQAPLGPRWQRFLTGGPALWSVRQAPPFPSGRVLAQLSGHLVQSPFVRYLSWRRGLDPVRFDTFHPVVGPLLAKLPGPTAMAPPPPPVRPPTVNPAPQVVVPEPNALLVGLCLASAALGVGWRDRLARRDRDDAAGNPAATS